MPVKESQFIDRYPVFKRFVESVYSKSPMQKKYLAQHFAKRDSVFWGRAERFSGVFMDYLVEMNLTVEQAVDAYLEVCRDMLTSQMKFKKTQKYSCPSASEAQVQVYSAPEKMTNYMIGLLLSQFLWPNHYEMYDFFISQNKKLKGIKTVLEIGPGHGLYLAESIALLPAARFEAIDISPTSKKLSEAFVRHLTGAARCEVRIQDVNSFSSGMYDYVVMGEVLEHFDDPMAVLKKIHRLLNKGGHFFITTCANAPAIDHVHLYESIEVIQRDLKEAGFALQAELALPVEDVPRQEWAQKRIEVNYAAMLKKV